MGDLTLDTARPHMTALADELSKAGAIRTPQWHDTFAAVPRHVLVPTWFEQEQNAKGITVWRQQRATADERYLAAAYRDVTLVTALDPATSEQVDDTAWTGFPTSSSTLPSLMAGMLEGLSVRTGHRVLEIGTGTGYNAALLCARLGDRLVHSIDVDPDLVDTARTRLARIGYTPGLTTGDGCTALPDLSFERIIATCSVPGIPQEWIEHAKPGAVIVADVALGIEGGLVRLTVDEDRRAIGHFTTTAGRFMPARSDPRAYPQPHRPQRAPEAESRPTTLTAPEIQSHYTLRLLLALQLPETELVYDIDDATGAMSIQLQRSDGAWARVPFIFNAEPTVTYGGDPNLWKQAETTWHWWKAHNRPAHDQFGYVREANGDAAVWHIPDGTRWHLTTRGRPR
ncbi:methyltransferase domain-containing protein [Streptomyces sp. MNP-20]|uniref:methyltransferase domain-containing protein n=1 Tax=Streptomyces sp. MNP-20 TaxID=2721165 RepID=UPI002815B8A0|nr:methyltransferase domain-containing protein [Streptomyces sp. MNP-20]